MSSAWSFSYVLFRFSTYCIITSVAFDMRFSCRDGEEKLISPACSEPGSGIGVLEANSPGGTGASLPEPQDPRARETCSDKLLSSWAQNRPRKKLRLEPPDSGLPGASVSGAVWVEFP